MNCDAVVFLRVNSAFRATINQPLTNLAALEVTSESFNIGLDIACMGRDAALFTITLILSTDALLKGRKKKTERKEETRPGKKVTRYTGKKERKKPGRKDGKKERNLERKKKPNGGKDRGKKDSRKERRRKNRNDKRERRKETGKEGCKERNGQQL